MRRPPPPLLPPASPIERTESSAVNPHPHPQVKSISGQSGTKCLIIMWSPSYIPDHLAYPVHLHELTTVAHASVVTFDRSAWEYGNLHFGLCKVCSQCPLSPMDPPFNPALNGIVTKHHWRGGGDVFRHLPQTISKTKRRSQTGEAAFESAHGDAPNAC